MIQILFNDAQINIKNNEKEKLAQDILDKDENFEERKEYKSLINSINEKYKNTNLSYQEIKQKIKDKQYFGIFHAGSGLTEKYFKLKSINYSFKELKISSSGF